MTALTWPAQLPMPERAGYRIEPGEQILRTDMDSGAARQRRFTTTAPTRISVNWLFTPSQMGLFEGWYESKADAGGRFFAIDLLSGLGMVAHEARFTGPFRAEKVSGNLWAVQAELEIRDRPILTEEALDIALSEDVDGLIAAIDAMSGLVNSTWAGAAGWN